MPAKKKAKKTTAPAATVPPPPRSPIEAAVDKACGVGKKTRKAPVRRVFGRLVRAVGGKLTFFELTKDGLVVRPMHTARKRATTVGFEELAIAGAIGRQYEVGAKAFQFSLTARGVEVRRPGDRDPLRVLSPDLVAEGAWAGQQTLNL